MRSAPRLALALVGLNLALWLPLNVFDATLWAYQRFDLINIIEIISVAIRTTLTFALIGNGYGIVTLAWLNLITLAGRRGSRLSPASGSTRTFARGGRGSAGRLRAM